MSKYYSESEMRAVRGAFEREVLGWPGVSQRKMLGCPCYWSRGKMFAFLTNGGVVLTQLSEAERSALGRKFATSPFGSGARVVERWPRIPVAGARDLKQVLPFVRKSYESLR